MRLPDHYATPLREHLAEHARLSKAAAEANDLSAAKDALTACWLHRIRALEIINEAEREARAEAIAKLGAAA